MQWCHGAPGFLPLLLKLRSREADLSGPGALRALDAAADRAADVVWERGLLTKVLALAKLLKATWLGNTSTSAPGLVHNSFPADMRWEEPGHPNQSSNPPTCHAACFRGWGCAMGPAATHMPCWQRTATQGMSGVCGRPCSLAASWQSTGSSC